MRAWTFQDHRQKERLGKKAPWSVGWIDGKGRRRSKAIGSKSMADRYAAKVVNDLARGLCGDPTAKSWAEFRKMYEEMRFPGLRYSSQREIAVAFGHFERIIKPTTVTGVDAADLDRYISKRRLERGKKPDSFVAPHTILKEITCIHTALKKAFKWKLRSDLPDRPTIEVEEHVPRAVSEENFAKIYAACDTATLPAGEPYTPGEWWRALLLFAMTTGWRRQEILTFLREDFTPETGKIRVVASTSKNKKEAVDYLPPATVEHVKRILSFRPELFYWPHDGKLFDKTFHAIQKAAGVTLPCEISRPHKCTDSCFRHCLHDLRRGFATANWDLPQLVLQRKMRHASITTTLRYIAYGQTAAKMQQAAERIHVPSCAVQAS